MGIIMTRLIAGFTLIVVLIAGCAHSPRPWTTAEKIGAGVLIAGKILDTHSTLLHQQYPDKIRERNPILGSHPSDFEIVGYMATSTALALVIAHYFPKFRLPVCIGYGFLGIHLALGNYKTVRRVQ